MAIMRRLAFRSAKVAFRFAKGRSLSANGELTIGWLVAEHRRRPAPHWGFEDSATSHPVAPRKMTPRRLSGRKIELPDGIVRPAVNETASVRGEATGAGDSVHGVKFTHRAGVPKLQPAVEAVRCDQRTIGRKYRRVDDVTVPLQRRQ